MKAAPGLALTLAAAACSAGDAGYDSFAFDTLHTLGKLEGSGAEVIGRIVSVDVDADGRVLILDSQTPSLLVYDSTGNLVATHSARGSGPGEMLGPRSARWERAGAIRLLDPRNARMQRYTLNGQGIADAGAVPSEIVGSGLCRIGDEWFTQQLAPDGMLHGLDDGGRRLVTFAPMLDISQFVDQGVGPLMAVVFAAGPIACVETPDIVLALPTSLPTVRAFSPDGQPLWEVELDGYVPLEVEASPTSVRSHAAPGGSHVALGIERWDDEAVLVQLEVRQPESVPLPDGADYHAIESRFLSLADGSELGRTMQLPRVGAVWRNRIYVIRTNPFPQVLVLRRTGR
jgi:hypothetical protein